MKKNLHKLLLTMAAIGAMGSVDAKVWRVNNATGVAADFVQLSAAIANPAVLAGDTIHVEGSSTAYNRAELKKRLVIIGPGYHLSGTGSNAGLQYHDQIAYINGLVLDSLGSGSVVMGLSGYMYLQTGADNYTITRNNIDIYTEIAGQKASNIKIVRNQIDVRLSAVAFEDLEFTNNIVNNNCLLSSLSNTNVLFRNNTISSATANVTNAYISNNIFLSTVNFVNCTIKYNIATGLNTLPAGDNNQNNRPTAALILNTGSNDGKFQLAPGSPAIAAGEPINGITPDCGAFGTADPYRLSGIAPVPTIYSLTVPASVPSSATTMTVTISTRSNN
ncbi:MAG: hypothetical protein J7527_03360 [Chitinophagaceae bacterium]|nr:hypothetical protein [Chitinophagaceae bacterium]